MKEALIAMVSGIAPEWATVLLAMMPVGEVRVSVPVAIVTYKMSVLMAMMWSLVGNILAGVLVLAIIEPVIGYLIKHWNWLNRLWKKYIYHLETKNKAAFDKWGSLILILFVAIPLPMTGIYSGAIAASIFQIPFMRAITLLALGSIISTSIVASITVAFAHAL